MAHIIRAKFRCMGINHRWDGKRLVDLLPVAHRGGYMTGDSVDAEENLKFWDATPSGSSEVTFSKGQTCFFVPGGYYYIDMVADPEGEWTLNCVSTYPENINVSFSSPWDGKTVHFAKLEMGITNKDAWPPFIGKAGTNWKIEYVPV